MSVLKFDYEDYQQARKDLIQMIHDGLNNEDKNFLLSYELGEPDWELCSAGDLSEYPSVQWKLLNIRKLRETNKRKFEAGIKKLRDYLMKK